MAGGSYNGNSARPAHPAPLHKLQHGWITASTVTSSVKIDVKPYTATTGHVYKLVSPAFTPKQYLLLESRKRVGFDFDLPGEGLLVWKVDEVQEQFAPAAPGMSLVQADGRNDLNNPSDWNQGDAADPFPGSENKESLNDTGPVSTSFPGKRSGISLRNIRFSPEGVVTLEVRYKASAVAKKVASAKQSSGSGKITKGGARRESVSARRATSAEEN
jgi:immune inhibitor A